MHCCNKIKISFPSVFPSPFFSQHLFASEHRDDIIRSAIEHAGNFIGITLRLRKDALTFENFMTDRLGKYSSDESITSLAEFVVQKITPRHPVRTLCFSLFPSVLSGFQSEVQEPTRTLLRVVFMKIMFACLIYLCRFY